MLNVKWSLKNYIKNLYFVIFSLSYGMIQVRLGLSFLISTIGIICAISYVLGKVESVKILLYDVSKPVCIISIIHSIGITLANYQLSRNYFLSSINSETGKIQSICSLIGMEIENFKHIIFILFAVFAILSIPFIYMIISFMLKNIFEVFRDSKIREFVMSFSMHERLVYMTILFFQIVLLSLFFKNSVAGYAGPCDIIYGTDSATYGDVAHFLHVDTSNIRQPLLEVIASPFIGYCYLFKFIPYVGNLLAAIFMQGTQIVLLMCANILLLKNLEIDNQTVRVLGIILISLSYSNLEGCLIVEKYIFSYFWLMLYCSHVLHNKRNNEIVSCTLTGSMITSAFIVPFIELKKSKCNIKETLINGLYILKKMVFYIAISGHLGVILLRTDTNQYIENGSNGIASRIYQFFGFWASCVFRPQTEIINRFNNITWFLKDSTGINLFGVAIFLFIILALYFMKSEMKLPLSLWVILSFILFIVGGWGTAQNELAIYYLYFSWVFFALAIYYLAHCKIKTAYMIVIWGILLEAYINIPAIYELIMFSVTYYPA